LLQGLYFLHVSAHRQRANEWSDVIDIDPGAFQSISDNLVSSYKQLLSEAGDWSAEMKSTMRVRTLLKSSPRSIAGSNCRLRIILSMWWSTKPARRSRLSVYEISAGDHLVFYDTMGRKLRAGQHLSSDNIIAFEANTSGCNCCAASTQLSHKKISEIDAHRPAKRSSSVDTAKFESLPRSLSLKHDRVGAPYTPFDYGALEGSFSHSQRLGQFGRCLSPGKSSSRIRRPMVSCRGNQSGFLLKPVKTSDRTRGQYFDARA
jgi:hypothetical protein